MSLIAPKTIDPRATVRSLWTGLAGSRKRAAEFRRDRFARPNPGPTPDRTTMQAGMHPSMSSVAVFR